MSVSKCMYVSVYVCKCMYVCVCVIKCVRVYLCVFSICQRLRSIWAIHSLSDITLSFPELLFHFNKHRLYQMQMATLSSPRVPGFSAVHPVIDGCCMGNRKKCSCGAAFL